jgi:hypothetical protein
MCNTAIHCHLQKLQPLRTPMLAIPRPYKILGVKETMDAVIKNKNIK